MALSRCFAAAAAAPTDRARRHGRTVPEARRRGAGQRAAKVPAGDLTADAVQGAVPVDITQEKLARALSLFEQVVNRPDAEIEMLQAAALLALHTDPDLDAEAAVFAPVSHLCGGFRRYVDASASFDLRDPGTEAFRMITLAVCLCSFMAREGFRGCDRSPSAYYRAENSLLHKVLETRCGLPISLSLLYIAVGRSVGLELRGINFPGHFLLAFGSGSGTGLVDAFDNRLVPDVETSAILKAVGGELPTIPNVLFLMRMLRNLQGVYENDGKLEEATRIVQYTRRLQAVVQSRASR